MKKNNNAYQTAIRSANDLLLFLGSIKTMDSLNNIERIGVDEDISSINRIIELLTQANSKEQNRDVWNTFRDIDKNFGGYIGDRSGAQLELIKDRFWKSLLNLLSESQDN